MATIGELEARVAALEAWRERVEHPETPPLPSAVLPDEVLPDDGMRGVDVALIGRTLLVLGGAYLLRAVTESGAIPAAAGVLLGLLYAASWSLLSLRGKVTHGSAAHHTTATVLTALPLIFEATTKFKVFHAWSAALALSVIAALVLVIAWRRNLHGVAWTVALLAIALSVALMDVTDSIVPFALHLTALGIATVWLAYVLEWRLLRWFVAAAVDLVLMIACFLVVTNRLPALSPATAIAVCCVAIAAYLATFAVRTLLRQRDVVAFEIAQTIVLLLFVLGGAIWVAASRVTLVIPLAAAILTLGGASYAVSFAFIPRRFATPANFVFYSSLALLLIVMGGALLAKGITNSILWSALASISGFLSMRYRKSSLALHSAVYLFSGFVGADLLWLGVRSLLWNVDAWLVPHAGALLLLVASVLAAGIRPIERMGNFELWTTAKVMILAETGWALAAIVTSAAGARWLGANPDPAIVAVLRTAVLGGLTGLTAWISRYPTLSPGRLLCTPLLVILALKLVWEDLRVGRPATLFVSFAIAGVVLLVTPRFRRRALLPQAAPV